MEVANDNLTPLDEAKESFASEARAAGISVMLDFHHSENMELKNYIRQRSGWVKSYEELSYQQRKTAEEILQVSVAAYATTHRDEPDVTTKEFLGDMKHVINSVINQRNSPVRG